MGKFFTVDVIPDVVDGDVSDIVDGSKNGVDIGAGEIVFDWTAVDVPKGGSMLRSISVFVNGENGAYAAGSLTNYELVFAKSVDGINPPTLGNNNDAQTGCFGLRHHYVGSMILDSTTVKATLPQLAFGVGFIPGSNGAGDYNNGLPLVIDLEPSSGTNVGYDKLFVAAFQTSARHYGTDVLVNGAIDADVDNTKEVVVDGIDARKIFSVGDQVYFYNLDTPVGSTLTKVEELKLTFKENIDIDLGNNGELINANPIRIKLGFEK